MVNFLRILNYLCDRKKMTSLSSHKMQMTIFRVSTVSITIFMCKKIIGWKFVFLNFDKKHVLSTFCLHIYIVICHKNASFFLLVASLVSTQQHKTEMQEYIKWLVDAFFIVFISATKYTIQRKSWSFWEIHKWYLW